MTIDSIAYGKRARVGVLLPSGNIAAEAELRAILPYDVGIHVTRLPLKGSSREELLGMTEGVEHAAALLADTEPSLIVFHCTAVSTWDPAMDSSLCQRISVSTATQATTTAQAIINALRALNAKKVVVIGAAPVKTGHEERLNFEVVLRLCLSPALTWNPLKF
ncbi:aspartate racemase/maleate isomerase family protein [Pandoraea norimbergensis]